MGERNNEGIKPKINQEIFIIYQDAIVQEKVYMLGENEFAHSSSFSSIKKDDYKYPLKYDDFNKTWFTSLQNAKTYLGGKIKKIYEGYWEKI